jgi:hypothetical protein
MTKFSDNGSEGSYHHKQVDKYKTTTKQSQLVPQNSGGLNDLKIENSKNHTFASDLEDSPSIQGLTGTNLVSCHLHISINYCYKSKMEVPPYFTYCVPNLVVLASTATDLHAEQEGSEEEEQQPARGGDAWRAGFQPDEEEPADAQENNRS